MDKMEFATFPKNKTDALAILYLQSQDLSGLSPSELADKYTDVRKEISNSFSGIKANNQK